MRESPEYQSPDSAHRTVGLQTDASGLKKKQETEHNTQTIIEEPGYKTETSEQHRIPQNTHLQNFALFKEKLTTTFNNVLY